MRDVDPDLLVDQAMSLEAALKASPENRPDSLKGKSDEWIMAELARIKNTMREAKNPRRR